MGSVPVIETLYEKTAREQAKKDKDRRLIILGVGRRCKHIPGSLVIRLPYRGCRHTRDVWR